MSSVTPSELYQDPANINEISRYRELWPTGLRGTYTLDEILPPLDAAVQNDDLTGHLRSLDDVSDRQFVGATLALSGLPPQTVFDTYGEEVLVWTAANSIWQRVERLKEGLMEHAGYDGGFLLKAINLNQKPFPQSVNAQHVINDYRLMEHTQSGIFDAIDLKREIHNAAKPDIKLSNRRANDYSLQPVRVDGDDGYPRGHAKDWAGNWVDTQRRYTMYLDLPTGFSVNYKGLPQAVATFRAHGDSGLLIGQMQGVRGDRFTPKETDAGKAYVEKSKISGRGLMPLDWQRLLVNISELVAKSLDKDSLTIHTRGVSTYITGDQALKMYDEPAQAMGFVQGEDGHWHKPIH